MTLEEYWNQDASHQEQKFYTAFCLLGSACNVVSVTRLRELHEIAEDHNERQS